jgi:hypothetical protein
MRQIQKVLKMLKILKMKTQKTLTAIAGEIVLDVILGQLK